MRSSLLIAALVCASPVLAQSWFIPNNDPTTGTCNVIPFGQSVGGPFYNVRYQARCTAAELGNLPNLITGLGFAPCLAGRAHYDNLEIVIDHIPASQPLTTTFASNLTPFAVTVLSGSNYTWNVPANQWYEVGLQTFFVFNGVDDVVIQITSTNGTAPVQGFHRDTRQRVYWIGTAGPPPLTGSTDNAALKFEVSMLMGKLSSHGDGCPGSNGTPLLTMSGSAVVGNTASFDLANGVPFGVALHVLGFTNGAPFPLDLGILGAPGCFAYTDLAAISAVVLDGSGAASFPIAIPATALGVLFYGQYAVLDIPANTFGFTTSGYGRVHTGN